MKQEERYRSEEDGSVPPHRVLGCSAAAAAGVPLVATMHRHRGSLNGPHVPARAAGWRSVDRVGDEIEQVAQLGAEEREGNQGDYDDQGHDEDVFRERLAAGVTSAIGST